jgi:enamine deaminase RidA (YjgF/YER057c/UK114 family)
LLDALRRHLEARLPALVLDGSLRQSCEGEDELPPPATGGFPMNSPTATRHGRVELISPDGLVKSPAFSHVAVVTGPARTIYIGGQDAVTANGEIVGKGDLAAQTSKILANVVTALAAAGAGLEHIVKWNLYVVEGQDIREGFAVYQRVWGDRPNPPLITGAFVKGLAHPDFLVEMDAIAVIPE